MAEHMAESRIRIAARQRWEASEERDQEIAIDDVVRKQRAVEARLVIQKNGAKYGGEVSLGDADNGFDLRRVEAAQAREAKKTANRKAAPKKDRQVGHFILIRSLGSITIDLAGSIGKAACHDTEATIKAQADD